MTFDEAFDVLVNIGEDLGFDPEVPEETEALLAEIVGSYHADDPALRQELTDRLRSVFVAVKQRPAWIQGANWPIESGVPLIFVGQLENLEGAVFFVFWNRESGRTKVVVQTD